MRITLDIDDDLLMSVKEIARHDKGSAGQIVSKLLRGALTGVQTIPPRAHRCDVAGFVAFPARTGVLVTNELVNRIRDEEGI